MNSFEAISITTATLAVIFSGIAIFFQGSQTRRMSKSLELDQQNSLGNATIHFTSRFMDLVRDGKAIEKIDDPDWSYRFWTLISTEFYFFHHQMLPHFMFKLWMYDLCELTVKKEGQERCGNLAEDMNNQPLG